MDCPSNPTDQKSLKSPCPNLRACHSLLHWPFFFKTLLALPRLGPPLSRTSSCPAVGHPAVSAGLQPNDGLQSLFWTDTKWFIKLAPMNLLVPPGFWEQTPISISLLNFEAWFRVDCLNFRRVIAFCREKGGLIKRPRENPWQTCCPSAHRSMTYIRKKHPRIALHRPLPLFFPCRPLPCRRKGQTRGTIKTKNELDGAVIGFLFYCPWLSPLSLHQSSKWWWIRRLFCHLMLDDSLHLLDSCHVPPLWPPPALVFLYGFSGSAPQLWQLGLCQEPHIENKQLWLNWIVMWLNQLKKGTLNALNHSIGKRKINKNCPLSFTSCAKPMCLIWI